MHMVFNAEAKIEMVKKMKVEIGEETYGCRQIRGMSPSLIFSSSFELISRLSF